jgi:trk system potassium uptake protein TrkA
MRIVIVGGGVKVDFLATSLIKKKHQLVIIDLDQDKCQALSEKSNAVIICGDGTKPFILEDAGVAGFDLMIAVTSKDADNLVICQLAKKMFGIRRAFATVNNPRNVEVFKKLGINTAVSATYVLAGIIEQMAFTDQIVHAMPLEEGKLQLLEVIVEEGHRACGKQIMDLDFPKDAIYRLHRKRKRKRHPERPDGDPCWRQAYDFHEPVVAGDGACLFDWGCPKMSTNFKGIYVLRYIGVMLMFVAGVILFPLMLLPFYPSEEKYTLCFMTPAAACFITGLSSAKFMCRTTAGCRSAATRSLWPAPGFRPCFFPLCRLCLREC